MNKLANGNVMVMHEGEKVEVSAKEYHMLYLRDHLILVYKGTDFVNKEAGFLTRRR